MGKKSSANITVDMAEQDILSPLMGVKIVIFSFSFLRSSRG